MRATMRLREAVARMAEEAGLADLQIDFGHENGRHWLTRPPHHSEGADLEKVGLGHEDLSAKGQPNAAGEAKIRAFLAEYRRLLVRDAAILAGGHKLTEPPAWAWSISTLTMALLRHVSVDPLNNLPSLPHRGIRRTSRGIDHWNATAPSWELFNEIIYSSRRDLIHVRFLTVVQIADDVRTVTLALRDGEQVAKLTLHGTSLPLSLVQSLAGHPLNGIVQHPALAGVTTPIVRARLDGDDIHLDVANERMPLADAPAGIDLSWRI